MLYKGDIVRLRYDVKRRHKRELTRDQQYIVMCDSWKMKSCSGRVHAVEHVRILNDLGEIQVYRAQWFRKINEI